MDLLAIYYKLIVLEPLFFIFVIFQIILSPRQVVVNERSIAHFSCVFEYFSHASTCNPSCVELSYLWEA